jgi:P4 family phage/plasmid primase-like protien
MSSATIEEPRLILMDWKSANAFPKPQNGVSVYLVPFSEAVATRYRTDAHFQAITTTIKRRLNNDAIGRVPIAVTYFVGDIDDPVAHLLDVPARESWRAAEKAKLAELRKRHPRVVDYDTRGGYRIVARCAQPFAITTSADKEAWWARYLEFRRYIYRTSGIVIDPTCKDFGRLYRFPRVRRKLADGRFEDCDAEIHGDTQNIEALDAAAFGSATTEPPDDPISCLNKFVRAALLSAGTNLLAAENGARNETLNRETFSLAGFVPTKHLDRELLKEVMLTAILANGGDATRDGRRIDDAVEAGIRKPRDAPFSGAPHVRGARRGAPMRPPERGREPTSETISEGVTDDRTDLRNAERLVEWFGRDLRYCSTWGKWLAWDGIRWQLDDQCRAHAFAKEAARRLLAIALDRQRDATEQLAEATALDDDEAIAQAKKVLVRANRDVSHAIGSQNASRIDAMLAVAKSDRALVVHHNSLDADPWLFNVPNGTIELRTGELRGHRREDLITKLAPVVYEPDATAPIWLAFLERAMGGLAAMVDFLACLIGYALTGDVREHIVAFFFGAGANGKSTFLGIVHAALGDYATPAPRHLLFRSRGDRHPTELASLHSRRFVTCSEIEEGLSWDEALVKDLTGGDPIECRRMREDFWTYLPSHKLFIAGNHKPQVRGDDEGIWRRMRLVPWTVTIPEAEQDKELPDKLRGELPGILAWAVRGSLEWQRNGLRAPNEVRSATDAYRSENDVLGQFFRLHLVFERDAKVSRKDLRNSYEAFCVENGIEPLGAKRFTSRLREQGVTETTMRTSVHTHPQMIPAGQYEGKAIKGKVQLGETERGTLQIAIDMDLFDTRDQSIGQMTTFLYFTDASAAYSYERLRLLGWKGEEPEDINKLHDIFDAKVPVRVTAPESYKAADGTMKMGKSKLEILMGGTGTLSKSGKGVVDAWRGVRLATEEEHEAAQAATGRWS